MEIENTFVGYKDDECKYDDRIEVKILSHWNDNNKVWIEFNGQKVVVLRSDIEKAIDNACNH
jgi:sRNA-binding carbon storage regulator CsrA